MKTRRLFAAAVLAAVTLCVGSLDAQPTGWAEATGSAAHATETGNGPRVFYASGHGWIFSNVAAWLIYPFDRVPRHFMAA